MLTYDGAASEQGGFNYLQGEGYGRARSADLICHGNESGVAAGPAA